MNTKFKKCSPGEDRCNPFNDPTPDVEDDSQLIANEWEPEEYHTDTDGLQLQGVVTEGSGSTAASGHMQNRTHDVHPHPDGPPDSGTDLTTVINYHACIPNVPTTTADSVDPREPQSAQIYDGPMTQDTVTVWVPGGEVPRPGCGSCRQYFQCGYWVVAPSLVLLLGIAVTAWVWVDHGRDPYVMKNVASASAVLIGPILTLLGLLGIFIACIMHEIHARRRYDPLQDDAPNEEFL